MHLSIFCHLSRQESNRKTQIIQAKCLSFWQLHPAVPGESHVTSRPPESCNPFSVLRVFPLGLLQAGLTCFLSKGRRLSSIVARFIWLHSVLNSQVLLDFWASRPLTEIVPVACREALTLTAWIFVLILSATGDCKWGLTGRPNTEWIYIESSACGSALYLPAQANTGLALLQPLLLTSLWSSDPCDTHVKLMNKLFIPHLNGEDIDFPQGLLVSVSNIINKIKCIGDKCPEHRK